MKRFINKLFCKNIRTIPQIEQVNVIKTIDKESIIDDDSIIDEDSTIYTEIGCNYYKRNKLLEKQGLTKYYIQHTIYLMLFQYNIDYNKIIFPNTIKHIVFPDEFDDNIDNITLPENLEVIEFRESFNQSMNKIKFPDKLQAIKFASYSHFNQNIDNIKVKNLKYLKLGCYYTHPLYNLPDTLEVLVLTNYKFELTNLPISLKVIKCDVISEQYIKKSRIPFGCELIVDS